MVIICCFSTLNSQSVDKTNIDRSYQKIPQESIFLHYNASLNFAGEYIYYKVYCINTEEDNLSMLSKVAYVELISEDKKVIFKHKIELISGMGQGDFLVPNNVVSGNYKLIGYTNWMKNGDIKRFFQEDIALINPYQSNQDTILNAVTNNTIPLAKTRDSLNPITSNIVPKEFENEFLALEIEKEIFKKREKVSFNLKSLKGNQTYGNYSLSVKKISTISNFSKPAVPQFKHNSISDDYLKTDSKYVYLPELRGDIISGKLIDKNTELPLAYKKIVLSIPGKHYILKVVNTNEKGIFYFNINESYDTDEVLMQVVGENKQDYLFIMNNQDEAIDYSSFSFNKFKIDPSMKDAILERSIYNQIENAYFNVKSRGTVQPLDSISPFYGNLELIYNLNDYTRFSTVRETLVEIVSNVWAKKMKNDEYIFQMRPYEHYTGFFTPWVIVDGVLFQNHNEIMNFSSKKIKKIGLLRDKYILGGQTIEGVIVFETIDGDFYKKQKNSFIEKIKIVNPLLRKKYSTQVYTEKNRTDLERVPDFREQLLWEPNITFDQNEMSFDFFTSDNIGVYEICLKGFNITGKPITLMKRITIK